MSNATVCLNMIVKNEAHLIRQTLEMLCSKIRFDYWVICDTGSTDATREIIQDFFGNRVHIPGELHCDEWVNFGHNRTKALTYAHNKTDLLLVFDADDAICGTIPLPTAVTHDEYHLKFGAPNTGDSTYTRTQLINNRKRFRYYSVLHEYISCLEPSPDEGRRICVLEGDYYVVSGRSGARNRDPDKYLKDALLLEAAHAEALAAGDDLHMRYAFYCANSYRDCGRYEDAIRWYKTTLSQDNWVQEKYLACIYAHDCYAALGQKEHGFFYLVKSLSYDLERAEGVYALIQHYCSCSTPPASDNVNFQIAYNYYRIVQPHYERAQLEVEPQFKLFVQPDKANFFLPYYMIIVADRVGDRACGIRMYEIIFRKKQRMVGHWYLRNLFYNVRCFVEHIRKDTLGVFAALANDYLRFLRENGVPLSIFDEVASTYDYGAYGIELSLPHQSLLKPQTFSRAACRSSRAILFYTGYISVPWNYSGMTRGALGGSEKAVAYLSLELLKLGYTVYVSGDVQPEEIAIANNTQCSLKYVALPDLPELLRTTAFHTIVCSRYVSFLELYGATASWYQFYIWAHDTHLLPYGCALSDTAIVEKWSARIDGCVCQTRWHADEYARQYPTLKSRIRVINNGIDTALFPALGSLGKKVRNRFIYTSRTERGLSRILDLWPDIIAALPDATLVISTYVAFPCNDDERRIQARIAELNQIHPGQKEEQEHCIRHLGQLNPAQLYAEMGAAEYWLYPTDWPETSCITAMEMLMSGVICLYYPVAGLTDTMGGCGIQVAPGSELETLCRITSDETQKAKQREQGRAYAEGCTWTHRAQQWVQTLNPSNTLQTLKKNTMQEYDFGIFKSQTNSLAPRIQKIVDFLRCNHFSVHECDNMDSEVAKCKIILNAHASTTNDAFENADWFRLIEAGINVVSEPCCDLDAGFMQQYPNARVIAYDDFFDIGTMVDCYNNPFASNAHNAHVLSVLNKCYHEIDFIPVAHISFLKKLSLEFNPEKMVVYDIGSSVLHWSWHVQQIWKHPRIYAFDAMTEMKLYYDTYNETKNAALQFEYSVGVLCDEDHKRIAFYQNDDFSGGNSYYKEIGHPNSHNLFTETHVKHKMGMKLETVVKNRHFPLPDLIKIDVQGAELDILKGSMSIINCAKFLIVELQHTEYNRGAPLCNETRDFLIENGWEVYAEKFSNNGPDADWCFINRNRNGTPQVSPPAYKTMIINLKRRSDRKVMMESRLQAQTITEYEFVDAVDGSQLLPTAYIQRLFHGNNFNYRKGVIGCAMSHLALWQRLMHDTSCDVYVVMEDDAELVHDFELKLEKAVRLFMGEPRAELCLISTNCLNSVKFACNNNLAGMQVIKKNNKEVDGTGGYLIKKSGAIRFVDYYDTHSMKVAIDAALVFDFNDHLYELNEYLIKSIVSTDTDVQGSARFTTTIAFCDWWNDEYGGGTFNLHDNFFVNLIKTHCGDNDVVTVDPSQNPDILFYSVFGQSNGAYHAGRKVFYAGEPVPHRSNADFNITFDASNAINTRLPLWVCYFDHAILTPNRFPPIPTREKFCSYIATNPRANRQAFVDQLSSQYKRVDCGGKHLNNIGGAIPPGTNASGKIEHGKQYKFAIAFENTQYPGYVTEKICDVYKSGCIPIYWGTPDIIKDFNPSTFINANDFPDLDALIDHIRRVDCDDALYASYFKDPVLSDEWMQIFTDPNHTFFKQLVSDILHI